MITSKKILSLVILTVLFFSQSGRISGNDSLWETRKSDSISVYKDSAIYYSRKGDQRMSLYYFTKSHKIAEKLYGPLSMELANSLINLAISYSYNWDYDKAISILKEAEQIYIKSDIENKNYLGYIYSSIGLYYTYKGDYYRASEYYSYAGKFLNHETQQPYIRYEASLYIRMAYLELTLNNYNASLDYFNNAYEVIKRIPENSSVLITYYINRANTYSQMKMLDKSIDLQLKAIGLCQKDSSAYASKLIILYNNIALDYIALGRYTEAKRYLNKGIAYQKQISQTSKVFAELHESIGNLYEKKEAYYKALTYYQKALQISANNFTEDDFSANPAMEQVNNNLLTLNILESKSNCLYLLYGQDDKFGYLDNAITTSLLQMKIIEAMRNSYQSFEAKLQLADLENHTYKSGLEYTNEAFKKTRDSRYSKTAFEISEKSRSAVLLSSLHELDARDFGEIPEHLLIREKKLLKDIAFYKESIYEENQTHRPDIHKLKLWESYLFEAQREREDLIELYEQKYPDYYELKYNTNVITPDKLQKQLPGNVSIIQYCLVENTLNIFMITKDNFHITIQPIDSNFYHLVNDYLNEYQSFDYSKQSYSGYTEFCINSKSLHDILILPVKKYINGKNLVIIPEGILSFLPFETLISEIPVHTTTGYYKDLSYLLYDFTISYAYSSTLYSELEKKTKKGRIKRLLAFAPEYSTDSIISFNNRTIVTRQNKYRKNLYPIPGVIEEVNAIKELIPSEVYTGKEATESNFKNVAESYDILHLAMHTIINNDNPMFSKLIFTFDEDTLNDGLLNTYEIFSLKLNARMVVLSACS
ncbi:MAG: CHAT domain-containing protein, partial [Bacteroidales bacterium]